MVGKRIKEYMEERKIKQTFLVNKTGLSATTISQILNGKRETKASEYFEICAALEVSLEQFAEKETKKPHDAA